MISCKDIKKIAKDIGFDICGLAEVSKVTDAATFVENWCQDGNNADMDWMTRNRDIRQDPGLLLEGAKSMIVCGLSYADFLSDNGNIARYAHGEDYHFVIKSMLRMLAERISERSSEKFRYRCFTDSAPILERYWAVEASLGWIGRNSMLINREFGSFLLFGEIVADFEVDEYDHRSEYNGCAECCRCVESCPSGAITEDKSVDCRRCISYLTIEHRNLFSEEQRLWAGKTEYIFGCDLCQECCPWNIKFSKHIDQDQVNKINEIFGRNAFSTPLSLQEWLVMDDKDFKLRFGKTALSRAGLLQIKRNIEAKQ